MRCVSLTSWDQWYLLLAKATYDLRALREKDASLPEESPAKFAEPVVSFYYENQYDYMLGMDVSAELGIVAAAETGGMLRASSLMTGKTVKTWDIGDKDNKVTSVKFAEDDTGITTILACCGPEVVELGITEKVSQAW